MFWNKYPYSDFHEMNLDWILSTVKKIMDDVDAIDDKSKEVIIAQLQEWLDDGTIAGLISAIGYLTPVINQIDTASGRESIADKKIPVIDENGQIYGSNINVIDLMIKPRLPATNSIPVFDRNGNLVPMCFDRNYPYITSDMLLLNTMINDVLMVDSFSDTFTGNSGITLKNGLKIMYGYIQIPLSTWENVGSIYQQNVDITNNFYKEFTRTPKVILGTPNNLNNPVWLGGCVATATGISRVKVFAPSNYTGLTPVCSYIAIGY